jgi:hypothetical protein
MSGGSTKPKGTIMDNQAERQDAVVVAQGLVGQGKTVVLSEDDKTLLAAVRNALRQDGEGLEPGQASVARTALNDFEGFCGRRQAKGLADEPDVLHKFQRYVRDHAEAGRVPTVVVEKIESAITAQMGKIGQAQEISPAADAESAPAAGVDGSGAQPETVAAPVQESGAQVPGNSAPESAGPALVVGQGDGLANRTPIDVSDAVLDAQNAERLEGGPESVLGDVPGAVTASAMSQDAAGIPQAPSGTGLMDARELDGAYEAGRQQNKSQPEGRPMGVAEYLFRALGDRLSGRHRLDSQELSGRAAVPAETINQWVARATTSDERLKKLSEAATAFAALDPAADPAKVQEAKRSVDDAADAVHRAFQKDAHELLHEVNQGNMDGDVARAMLVERQERIDETMKRAIGPQAVTPAAGDSGGAPAVADPAAPAPAVTDPAAKADPADPAKKEGLKAYLSDVNEKLQEALKNILQTFMAAVQAFIKPKNSSGPRPR